MILFPAIDLFEGRVVRLKQGDFDSQTHYGHKPLDVARRYRDAGCTHLHIVDLEGARTGKPCHLRELEEMTELGFFGGLLQGNLPMAEGRGWQLQLADHSRHALLPLRHDRDGLAFVFVHSDAAASTALAAQLQPTRLPAAACA